MSTSTITKMKIGELNELVKNSDENEAYKVREHLVLAIKQAEEVYKLLKLQEDEEFQEMLRKCEPPKMRTGGLISRMFGAV